MRRGCRAAQETWFALSGLRERFHGLVQLSAERVRHLQPEPEEEDSGRDPEQIEAEARALRAEEFELGRQVEAARETLSHAEAGRMAAESAAAAEERRVAEAERAAADRREGLARLTGQVNAARSRARDAQRRDRAAGRPDRRGPRARRGRPAGVPAHRGRRRRPRRPARSASTPSTRRRRPSSRRPTTPSSSCAPARRPPSASAPRSRARSEALALGPGAQGRRCAARRRQRSRVRACSARWPRCCTSTRARRRRSPRRWATSPTPSSSRAWTPPCRPSSC